MSERILMQLVRVLFSSLIVMTHCPDFGACFWYQSTGTRNWSVCHTFLVPYIWVPARRARNRRRIEHVQFRAENRANDSTARLFVNKDER